jgi:hypothetical protein
MSEYYLKVSNKETLKSKVSAEILDFFVNMKIKNLEFKDLISLTDELLKYPYYEYI